MPLMDGPKVFAPPNEKADKKLSPQATPAGAPPRGAAPESPRAGAAPGEPRGGPPGEAGGRARPVALALLSTDGARGREAGSALGLARVPAEGSTVLARLVESIAEVPWVVQTALLAAPVAEDDALCAEAERLQVPVARPVAADPLSRLAEGLRALGAAPEQPVILLSIRGPLLCPEVISAAVEALLCGHHDHVATDLGSGVLPAGLDVEVTYARVLYLLDAKVESAEDRALGSGLLRQQRSRFKGPRLLVHELSPSELGPALERSGRYYASFGLGLEGADDLPLLQSVTAILDRQPEPRALNTLLRLLDQHPEWRQSGRALF